MAAIATMALQLFMVIKGERYSSFSSCYTGVADGNALRAIAEKAIFSYQASCSVTFASISSPYSLNLCNKSS